LKPVLDGDAAFVGVDLRTHPAELPPGVLSVAENVRMTDGKPQPRGGVAWQTPAGLPLGGAILHAGVYRPDAGYDRLALIQKERLLLWDTTTGLFDVVWYPTAETVEAAEAKDWIQAGIGSGTTREGYILRGFGKTVLKYDGSSIAALADPSGTPPTGGFLRGEFGLFYQDRIAVNYTEQGVGVSDFLDFTAWSQLSQFQILAGGDDRLMGAIPFQGDKVLIAGRKSIHVAYFDPATGSGAYDGNLKGETSWLRQITRRFGCVARRTLIEDGGTVYFLSDHGFVMLSATLDLELIGTQVALTSRLQPVMDRLSANYAGMACAVSDRERIYLALPINPEAVRVSRAEPDIVGSVIHTTEAHGLEAGDLIEMSGFPEIARTLNGLHYVGRVVSETSFEVSARASVSETIWGANRTWVQQVVQRNNTILVLNRAQSGSPDGRPYWESVDTLPAGVFADFLVVADAGSQRRVWMVDQNYGPALIEEGIGDEDGTYSGGIPVPTLLPVKLGTPNYFQTPTSARARTRRYSWGNIAQSKPVRNGRARMALELGDEASVTLRVYGPDEALTTSTETAQDLAADDVVTVGLGCRGTSAEVEVTFTAGSPVLNSVSVETLMETERMARP
jgi:hypothetical protein